MKQKKFTIDSQIERFYGRENRLANFSVTYVLQYFAVASSRSSTVLCIFCAGISYSIFWREYKILF